MSNINLYQAEQQDKKTIQAGLLDKGMIVGGIIFGIVLLSYGGVEMYSRSLDQKIDDSKQEEAAGREALNKEDVNLVASFQQRMDMLETEKNVFTKNDPAGIFQGVQSAMVQGSVASAMDLQGKNFEISFSTDSFETLAKQIMSFKKSDIFQDVRVESSKRGEDDERVEAVLTMTLSL